MGRKFSDLTNQRFGRLIAIKRIKNKLSKRTQWLCKCDCGNTKIVDMACLQSGDTRSCGCLKKKHGFFGSAIYVVWATMIQRCRNKNDKDYHNYGGRGITVCKRWLRFESFYADMGDRPEGLTLERLDNEKGYFPDNCGWRTPKVQANNKRTNIVIEYQGLKLNMMQWAEKIGIEYQTLWKRLSIAHWSIERALTERVR